MNQDTEIALYKKLVAEYDNIINLQETVIESLKTERDTARGIQDLAIKERDASTKDLNNYMNSHYGIIARWKNIAQTAVAEKSNLKKELAAAIADLNEQKDCRFCKFYNNDKRYLCRFKKEPGKLLTCTYEWRGIQP